MCVYIKRVEGAPSVANTQKNSSVWVCVCLYTCIYIYIYAYIYIFIYACIHQER